MRIRIRIGLALAMVMAMGLALILSLSLSLGLALALRRLALALRLNLVGGHDLLGPRPAETRRVLCNQALQRSPALLLIRSLRRHDRGKGCRAEIQREAARRGKWISQNRKGVGKWNIE